VTCPACESSKQRRHSGAYHLACLECCVRLVLSTHPSKRQAAVMLAAIERFRDAPGRAAILERVGQELAKRRSAPTKSGTACSEA